MRVKSIDFINSKLKKITKEDLREFGSRLEGLNLCYNELEVIESDLFEFNPNLEVILLHGNKIFHVEPGAFNGLENLQTLMFMKNKCMTVKESDEGNTKQKTLALIQEIEDKCKNENYTPMRIKSPAFEECSCFLPLLLSSILVLILISIISFHCYVRKNKFKSIEIKNENEVNLNFTPECNTE